MSDKWLEMGYLPLRDLQSMIAPGATLRLEDRQGRLVLAYATFCDHRGRTYVGVDRFEHTPHPGPRRSAREIAYADLVSVDEEDSAEKRLMSPFGDTTKTVADVWRALGAYPRVYQPLMLSDKGIYEVKREFDASCLMLSIRTVWG